MPCELESADFLPSNFEHTEAPHAAPANRALTATRGAVHTAASADVSLMSAELRHRTPLRRHQSGRTERRVGAPTRRALCFVVPCGVIGLAERATHGRSALPGWIVEAAGRAQLLDLSNSCTCCSRHSRTGRRRPAVERAGSYSASATSSGRPERVASSRQPALATW